MGESLETFWYFDKTTPCFLLRTRKCEIQLSHVQH